MSLQWSRIRQIVRMGQVLLGGVLFYAWVTVRESAIRGDLLGVSVSWFVIALSFGFIVLFEAYLGRIP